MARLEFFIVAESMSADQQTNRLSLFNVVELVSHTQFPFVLPYVVAVSTWMAEEGDETHDFQCTLRIILPGGKKHEFATNFKFIARRHRVSQGIQGFTIEEPGLLRFEILLNGEYRASHEADILKKEV